MSAKYNEVEDDFDSRPHRWAEVRNWEIPQMFQDSLWTLLIPLFTILALLSCFWNGQDSLQLLLNAFTLVCIFFKPFFQTYVCRPLIHLKKKLVSKDKNERTKTRVIFILSVSIILILLTVYLCFDSLREFIQARRKFNRSFISFFYKRNKLFLKNSALAD